MSKDNNTLLPALQVRGKLLNIRKIVRQPSQLKINYEVLAALCAMGCSLGACAAQLGTTSRVLDLKLRKENDGMTFHEFSQMHLQNFLGVEARRVLIEKALIDKHFPSLQMLAVNYLGMTKDGLRNQESELEDSSYTDEELIEILREENNEGVRRTKTSNEQRKSVTSGWTVPGQPRSVSPPVHNDDNSRSGSAGHGAGSPKEERGEGCQKNKLKQKPKVKKNEPEKIKQSKDST